MKTVHVYHYCAMSFLPNGDNKYITGIATYEDAVLDYNAYMDLTGNIAYTHDMAESAIALTSLSLLGTKEVDETVDLSPK